MTIFFALTGFLNFLPWVDTFFLNKENTEAIFCLTENTQVVLTPQNNGGEYKQDEQY